MTPSIHTETAVVDINAAGVSLVGDLTIPADAVGIVAFAHGSGSSRLSPRNREVAEALNRRGLATLLFDLLTLQEHEIDVRTRHLRFDIDLLTQRLAGAVDWVSDHDATRGFGIGLFGASTGATAALRAAAERRAKVRAVVSRGGRPDLAGAALPNVQAPTLLIVGSRDVPVIDMNEDAAAQMRCEHRIEIVEGATHLFEEPGTLEQVSDLAGAWFERWLPISE